MIFKPKNFFTKIRSIPQLLGLAVALFWLGSCSNEVEVIGVWKDIPVVYGVMNWADSVHYLRIERAYLPPNQSALDVAREVDSLYFDPNELNVRLYILNANNDTFPWPAPVERVNLADEGLAREDGIFQNNPSFAYKTTGVTSGDVLLEIEHLKTGNTFYARTESALASSSSLFVIPRYSRSPPRPINLREFNLQGNEIYSSLSIDISNGFASIYDYMYRFHYDEYRVDDQDNEIPGTRVARSIDWRAISDFIPEVEGQNRQSVVSDGFYRFLGSNLSDVTGTDLRRCPGHLEVFAVGASSSLREYIVARKANDGFVGGLFPAPPFSNVEGGYGVFATADVLERTDRASSPRLMELSDLSYEHLNNGEFTNNLGFLATPCF